MKKLILLIVVLAIAGVAYYLVSPLFNKIEVNEEIPDNVILPSETVAQTGVTSGFENLTPNQQAEMKEAMDTINAEAAEPMSEAMPENISQSVTTLAAVEGTTGHPASGGAKALKTTSGGALIRYENLETINGPKLHVYLAKDLNANEFVDLGPIKGTSGNINYTVPEGVNVEEYPYVMHWCVPFGVLFNYAEIN